MAQQVINGKKCGGANNRLLLQMQRNHFYVTKENGFWQSHAKATFQYGSKILPYFSMLTSRLDFSWISKTNALICSNGNQFHWRTEYDEHVVAARASSAILIPGDEKQVLLGKYQSSTLQLNAAPASRFWAGRSLQANKCNTTKQWKSDISGYEFISR